MFRIDAHPETEQLSRALSELGSRQLPFALSRAATAMAKRIKRVEENRLPRYIDNPTKTTENSIFMRGATKQKLAARVFFKDAWASSIPADRYMRPGVFGGKRAHKRFEKALIARGLMAQGQWAIPRPSVTDQNGNVKGGIVKKILSGLGAAETASGYQANATNSRRSRRKNNKRFFVAKIGKAHGVWERQASAFGSGVKLWFLFTDQEPSYSVKMPFFDIAEEQVQKHYMSEFTDALDYAIKTAR